MKLKHRHIIGICLLCGLLGFTSCINESFELPREEEENSIYLTFRTTVAGISTRADGTDGESDELIKQLLVVIVSEEANGSEVTEEQAKGDVTSNMKWLVEHSRLVKGASGIGLPLTNEYTFKVEAGCRKRIYLLANCEGLKDSDGRLLDFTGSSFLPRTDGTIPIDNFVFSLGVAEAGNDGAKADSYNYNPDLYGIPMTALYEIDIPDRKTLGKSDEYRLPEPLYVVRAATKLSFCFTKKTTKRNIDVTGFQLEEIIHDRMYLMPHVNKDEETGRHWVVDLSNGLSKRFLGEENQLVYTDEDWIKWMNQEAENCEDETEYPEKYQWLTDYEVPSLLEKGVSDGVEVSHVIDFFSPVEVPVVGEDADSKPVKSLRTVYLPESCNQKSIGEGESGSLSADLKLQEYELTIYTKEEFPDSSGKETGGTDAGGTSDGKEKIERKYTARLPYLASLFRNTHVKVNIVFNDYTIDWTVDVEPYWAVELEPVFGL